MSDAVQDFLFHARATDEAPQITYEGQSTFWKVCESDSCLILRPHIRRADHSECAVCGVKTYPVKKEGE